MATSQIKKFQKGKTSFSSWDLVVTIEDNGNFKVRVIPGLLNNFLATNWDIEQTLSGSGLIYAKAVVKTNGLGISNVSIKIDSSPPVIPQPLISSIPATVEIVFGLISNGVSYRTIAVGQIFVSPRLWMRKPKSEPVNAGSSVYDEYYFLS
jgi:hypothetical protein